MTTMYCGDVMVHCSVPAFKELSVEILSEIADALEEVRFIVMLWRLKFK